MSCSCAALDWSEVDYTKEHHPACVEVPGPYSMERLGQLIGEITQDVSVCDKKIRITLPDQHHLKNLPE